MEQITKLIKKDRPNIREITLKNYGRYLKTIMGGLDAKDIKIVKQFSKVKPYLESRKMSVRKALTASILVYLRAEDKEKNEEVINKYRIYLLDLNKAYNKDKGDREKNDRENNNWATLQQLHEIRGKLYKRIIFSSISIYSITSTQEYICICKSITFKPV